MTAVQDMLDLIHSIDIVFEAEEAIHDTRTEYVNKQREQLFKGKNEEGQPIVPAYTPRTVAIKKKKGQPTDRVTLKDTGDFYKEIFLDTREKEFVIDSADPKAGQLIEKYGEKIFGLDETNQEAYVNNHLDDSFVSRIEKKLE